MQEDGKVVIGTELDTKEFDKGLKDLVAKISAKDLGQKLKSSLGNVFSTILGLGKNIAKTMIGLIGGFVSTLGIVIKSLITGLSKVLLRTLGISTALGTIGVIGIIIGKAFQKVAENNQELIANIKYLIFVISQALAPAVGNVSNAIANSISKIINLLAKVITYIAYIIKMWFGLNILSGASVEAFKNSQKATGGLASNLGKASKNAKDLKKQLAGFDEMNVLQDNSSPGGGGADVGGGNIAMPTLDIKPLDDVDVPKWLKWIAENKDLVIAGLLGIATAIGLITLGVNGFIATGIGLIITGIVLLIQDIITFIKDPSWENFANILRDLSVILLGISVILIALNASNPVGWIILAISLITMLVAVIITNWDKVKAILSNVGSWIYENVITPVVNLFVQLWNKIAEIFGPIIAFYTPILQALVYIIKGVVDTIINIVKTIITNVKIIVNNIKTIVKPIFDFIKNEINNQINSFKNFVSLIKAIFEPLKPFFQTIISFIGGLLKQIGSTAGNIIAGAFKAVVNGILLAIETILNSPIRAINNLISAVRVVPGLKDLKTLKTFKFPRLAKGGIINMPGRGVPVGSAIAGERGQEGVIPLTDSQQMALLGEAIGRYITINASITNTMNGRVISRELQRINNESDFAYNR